MRVRENAESIAFYGGEESEAKLLFQRLGKVVANYGDLLVTSRNLSFFTSFYRSAPNMFQAAQICKLPELCVYETKLGIMVICSWLDGMLFMW